MMSMAQGAKRKVIAAIGFVIVLASLSDAAPTYRVEPCCDLCPRASVPAAYNTPLLVPFRVLIQGQDGWLFRSEIDLKTTLGPDPSGYQNLARFQKGLKARGIDLVIVYLPTRGLAHADKVPFSSWPARDREQARINYTKTLERFRQMGMIVPHMESWINTKNEQEIFFRRGAYWTPSGARVVAEEVADAITLLPSYTTIPRKKFITRKSGVMAKAGTLQKTATQLCQFGYPDQYVDQFETVPAKRAVVNGMAPQVVLLGTSNADRRYNFAGFLSEFLNVDILNLNDLKGKEDDDLLSPYLASRRFQDFPPKILIWEMQAGDNLLSHPDFYSQSMPWILNGCRSRKLIFNRKVDLYPGKSHEVLFNHQNKTILPLLGKNHQVDLQFSNPAVRKIEAVIWYTDGSKRILTYPYRENHDNQGRFVFALDRPLNDKDRTFLSLDVSVLSPVVGPTNLTAQLCVGGSATG